MFPQGWKSGIALYAFVLFLAAGLLALRDYGVSGDEPAVRKFGMDAFAYLFHNGPVPAEQDWAFFNPVIPVLLRGIELGFGLADGADIWFTRHLVTFPLLFGTIAVFHQITWMRFRDWKFPLIGSLMFMLSPRLFAHGMYNPKDIPALFFFMLSAWTLLLLLEKQSAARFIAHILSAALLISMRTFGLLIPVLAMLFLWVSPGKSRAFFVKFSLTYTLTLALTLALVWPMLWANPITGLLGALFNNTSRLGGGFYFGQNISGAGVPWHYLPVWIGITTPVLYSILFLTGFVTLMIRCARNPFCLLRAKKPSGIALLWFTLPVAALILLKIGIFDEWRHVLFLYPAFLLIALEGLSWILMAAKKLPRSSEKILRWIAGGVLALQLLSMGVWMIRNHPFHYVYFSIPTRFISGQFDLDYWGLSYRAGLEWIVKNDEREVINVHVRARVGQAAADTLPFDDWDRLRFVEEKDADYILDNFRGSEYRDPFPPEREVHAIVVDGLKILGIAKGAATLP